LSSVSSEEDGCPRAYGVYVVRTLVVAL
jgi:hypothetical protein